MRACAPEYEGRAVNDGVALAYEVFGSGAETVLLMPPWSIIHSRLWKAQVPYLSRHFRVVTFDPRGSGRSDRPDTPAAYAAEMGAADALAVLDATGTERCVLVVHCSSASRALILAVEHPERVAGAFFMAPQLPITPPLPERTGFPFDEALETDEGWAKQNARYWDRDFRAYAEFFFGRCFPEPHSTKQIEDCVGWALEGDPRTLAHTIRAPGMEPERVDELLGRLACPAVAFQGDQDALVPADRSAEFARRTGAELVTFEGAGHCPQAREPVRFNLVLREFAESAFGRRPAGLVWRRPMTRPRRALVVSSPIGLGHAWRDVAIVRELRARCPDLVVDWLAQDPVTRVLEACGERVHPISRHLSSESAHIEAEAGDGRLPVFEAWRRMDEILVANFMVFHDLVRQEHYDLWVGDEAWEVDHHLHENPELKTAPYAFLTDFVGWLPMPSGGTREAALTADYNLEMISQVERHPWVRDAALFVGEPQDVVPARFGPGLPLIPEWVAGHFDFTGYAMPPARRRPAVAALRRRVGAGPRDPVVVAAVGGSGVGGALLGRVIEAFARLRRRVPGARLLAVCGPRIDPAAIAAGPGVYAVPYVHDLAGTLAACDLAVIQGGLTTCMELVAAGRPFVAVPLRDHFEQNLVVPHRLARYGAPPPTPWDEATPARLAALMDERLGAAPGYAPVETGGAARAAAALAGLLESRRPAGVGTARRRRGSVSAPAG